MKSLHRATYIGALLYLLTTSSAPRAGAQAAPSGVPKPSSSAVSEGAAKTASTAGRLPFRFVRSLTDNFFATRVAPAPVVGRPDPLLPENSQYFEGSIPVDVKFQLSLAFDLIPTPMPIRGEFTYNQTSWWAISLPSAPFRETNYNPGGRVSLRMGEFCGGEVGRQRASVACFNYATRGATKLVIEELASGIEHISDGEGLRRVDETRSLNRFYTEARFAVTRRPHERNPLPRRYRDLHIRLKAWKYFGAEDQNWDIGRYLGYGEVELGYGYQTHGCAWKKKRDSGVRTCQMHWNPGFYVAGLVRFAGRARVPKDTVYDSNLKQFAPAVPIHYLPAFRLTAHFDLFNFSHTHPNPNSQFVPNIYLQWFYGYAESLKTYYDARSVLYVGLSLPL